MGLIRKVAKHSHTYRMVNVYLKESFLGHLLEEEEDYTNSSKSWVSLCRTMVSCFLDQQRMVWLWNINYYDLEVERNSYSASLKLFHTFFFLYFLPHLMTLSGSDLTL